MNNIQNFAVNVKNIPQNLQNISQWLVWKMKSSKKLPYNPITGRQASITNPNDYTDFETALNAYKTGKYSGLGIVLSKDIQLVGFDFDKCVAEDGTIDPAVAEHLKTLNTYTELSPSGKGIRAFAFGSKPKTKVNGELKDIGSRKGKFEVYDSARYLTVTGNRINGCEDVAVRCNGRIKAVCESIFGKEKVNESMAKAKEKSPEPENKANFEKLFKGDLTGYSSQSEADLALCRLFKLKGLGESDADKFFRLSGLYRDKWDKVTAHNKTYGENTLGKVYGGAVETAKPAKAENKNIAEILNNMGTNISAMKEGGEVMKTQHDILYVLDGIARVGEMTVINALPSSGKTLLTIKQLTENAKHLVKLGYSVNYVCFDDTTAKKGKTLLLAEHGVITIHYDDENCETFKNGNRVTATYFLDSIEKAIDDKKACEKRIYILDTLKKFVEVTEKTPSMRFNNLFRKFVQCGGTIVALAHVNKDKRVEAGVQDFRDDFDMAWELKTKVKNYKHTAVYTNGKARSFAKEKIVYSFMKTPDMCTEKTEEAEWEGYKKMLNSVVCLEDNKSIQLGESSTAYETEAPKSKPAPKRKPVKKEMPVIELPKVKTLTEKQKTVYDFIRSNGISGPKEIAEGCGMEVHKVKITFLPALLSKGLVKKSKYGEYEIRV